MRLYLITWPLWAPLHLASIGEWLLIPTQIAYAPLLFPVGFILHSFMFLKGIAR